jgi:Protein of unknown function (DUF559)/AbiEi antitoxin C-terminal domain
MSEVVAMLDDMSDKISRNSYLLFGIVTTAELLDQGTSTTQIRKLVRSRALVSLGHGVYARAAVAERFRGIDGGELFLSAAAAITLTGHDAVASHETAALLHGIALLDQPAPGVTLTAGLDRGWRGRIGVRLHAAALPAEHVTTALGVPITTPARTVVDLARTLDFRSGVATADSALHLRLTSKDELRSVIAACPRWPGLRRATEVVAFADDRAESPLESIARIVFRDCGLPRPELQVWLGGTTRPIVRVDFYWERYLTVAEVDGAMKYEDPMRAKRQLRRDSRLRAEGFEVVHFDWHDITQNPDQVVTLIRQAFARGRRTLAARARAGQARQARADISGARTQTSSPRAG